MEQRLDHLEKAVSVVHGEITDLKELLASGFKKVESNFDSVKTQVDSLNGSLRILNAKVDSLKGSTDEGFGSVGLKLENLTEEISKISEVTRYSQEYDNLKFFKK